MFRGFWGGWHRKGGKGACRVGSELALGQCSCCEVGSGGGDVGGMAEGRERGPGLLMRGWGQGRLGGCELKHLLGSTWREHPWVLKYPVISAAVLSLYLDADVLSRAGNRLVSNISHLVRERCSTGCAGLRMVFTPKPVPSYWQKQLSSAGLERRAVLWCVQLCTDVCTSAGCSEGSQGCPSLGALWCSHSHAGAAPCLPVSFLSTQMWLWSTKLKGQFKAVKEGDSVKWQRHIENSSVSPPVLKWLSVLCCEGSGCFLPSFQVGQFTVVQLFWLIHPSANFQVWAGLAQTRCYSLTNVCASRVKFSPGTESPCLRLQDVASPLHYRFLMLNCFFPPSGTCFSLNLLWEELCLAREYVGSAVLKASRNNA